MLLFGFVFMLALLYAGIRFSSAIMSVMLWFFFNLPMVLVLWGLGLVCFCTILLIPIGCCLFSLGGKLLFGR